MKSVILLISAAIWAILLIPSQSSIAKEYNALKAFKQAIYEDPLYMLSDWNQNEDYCHWTGISCSGDNDHVIILNLANSSLRGLIAPELGSLEFLQELILTNNLFLGAIPKQIGMLKSLNVLDLSSNRLTGPMPSEIGGLTSISKINFHFNGLTGKLPPELGNLKSLVELRVDRNKLGGSVPGSDSSYVNSSNSLRSSSHKYTGLCLLKQLNVGDFSYNFFVGKIPPCFENHSRYNFQGNCFLGQNVVMQRKAKQCGGYECGYLPTTTQTRSHKHHLPQQPQWFLILEVVTGVILVIVIVTAALAVVRKYCPKSSTIIPWKRTTKSMNPPAISIDGEMLKHVLRLSRHQLEVACEDFSNIISSSSDSIVYKGILENGSEIAVISLCINVDHWTSHLELYFQMEVANLARLTHENTAKLLGYGKESDPFTRMLVFEYASNGTLYEHLHYGEECQLSWSRRMKIILGIARGLRYMHNEVQPPFSLSDLRSSAVYLTEDFSPKLVDFESWKAVLSKAVLSKAENSGYIANGVPFQDSLERSQMDVQGNTFSFGVLLLEIISGRPLFCKDRGYIVDWAIQYLEKPNMMCNLVNPELKYFNHDDLRVICNVVSLSVQSEPIKRPSMQILAAMLEDGIDTSAAATLKESPFAWAELALAS